MPVDEGVPCEFDAGDPKPRMLTVAVPAEASQLAVVRDRLGAWLRNAGAATDVEHRLVLAVDEALTNAIVHAYPGGHHGTVRVAAEQAGDMVTVRVADNGQWRRARPLDGRGGRGVLLMQESADIVRIDRSPRGTMVTMSTALRRPRPVGDVDPAEQRHRTVTRMVGHTAVATLHGFVTDRTSTQLRRQLLAATCGGVVPLVVDTTGLESITAGLLVALTDVASAVHGTGERLIVTAPDEPARAALRPLESLDSVKVVLTGTAG